MEIAATAVELRLARIVDRISLWSVEVWPAKFQNMPAYDRLDSGSDDAFSMVIDLPAGSVALYG